MWRERRHFLANKTLFWPICLFSFGMQHRWYSSLNEHYDFYRSIRVAAAEQFLLISTWCVASQQPLQFCITLLFTVLNTTVVENARVSHEYFQLLCRLLNYAFMSNCPLPTAETLLNNEITWLKKIRVSG